MSLKARVEAVLFLTDKPIRAAAIAKIVNVDVQLVRQALIELVQDYEARSSGLEIAADDGYIIQVKDEFASIIDEFLPVEMSAAHIRTLSAIAIKQPIPQSDIIKIRGAGAYDHIKELLEKELINKDENQGGRSPILTTTKKFQEYFRLTKDAKSLRQMLRKQDKPETPEGESGEGEAEGFSEEEAQQLLLLAQSIAGEGASAPVEGEVAQTETIAQTETSESVDFAPEASSESMEATTEVAAETSEEVTAAATTEAIAVAEEVEASEDSDDDESDDEDEDESEDDDDEDDDESDEDEEEEDVVSEVAAKDESDSEDDDDDSDDDDEDYDDEDEEEETEEVAEDSEKTFSHQPVEMDEPFSPHSAAPDSVSHSTGDFIV
ncbi:MAG: SMC-Scp complex subunit ScpB [Candidatus Obscuribacterales bacterium]|nr:SMC-Scp complex subunit ScpB [Candidatus Obscuribacterales bacterium]